MSEREKRIKALEKLAYGCRQSPTVGVEHPRPTVGDVLSYIGVAQARDIGTQDDRVDAFGRIINSGIVNSSPASTALRMIGGGVLGRAITSAFTTNKFMKGLGTGFGAVSAIKKW